MAYVKLPEELRSWEVLLPNGGASRFEFSIFAGEAIGVEARGGDQGDPAGASLHIRSQRGRRRFDFSRLPVSFKPGEVAGVLAVLPEDEDDGPILCVANLDSDQRVDFLSREPEVLRLMTDQAVDVRRAAIGASEILGALVRAVGVGLAAAALTALALTGLDVGAGAVAADPASIAVAAGAVLLGGGAPLLAGAGVAFAAFGWMLTRRAIRLSRRARFQRELLDHLWRGAGEALGFVQDHVEAFRFGATIVSKSGPDPSQSPAAGEDVPNGEAIKPTRASRADVEDAQLLPIGPEADRSDASVADCDPAPRAAPRVRAARVAPRRPAPRETVPEEPAPRRAPPKLPSAWRRTDASRAAAERRREDARDSVDARETRPTPAAPAPTAAPSPASRRPHARPAAAEAPQPTFGPSDSAEERQAALARAKPTLQRARPFGPEAPSQHVAAARARLDIVEGQAETASERLARLAQGLRSASRTSSGVRGADRRASSDIDEPHR